MMLKKINVQITVYFTAWEGSIHKLPTQIKILFWSHKRRNDDARGESVPI